MSLDFINPASDPRVRHCFANLNGKNYHYVLGVPENDFKATIFLVHGWPDLSIGWRYQIPALLQAGYRVICPDIMGFGQTDAPQVPPEPMSFYSFKRAAEDIRELARQLGAPEIILGGHDWGGAIVYRVKLWFPDLVTHIFTVCTPYHPPSQTYHPLETLVPTRLPNWAYQIQLASGDVEKAIRSKVEIKQFLNAVYGGMGPDGEIGFDVRKGVLFENLSKLKRSRLMDEEMLGYYADQYSKNGLHGPLCWYRNREQNYQDELHLKPKTINVPVLFIQATRDDALPPAFSEGMERHCPQMTRKSVETGHWALWQRPQQVNAFILDWLNAVDKQRRSSL